MNVDPSQRRRPLYGNWRETPRVEAEHDGTIWKPTDPAGPKLLRAGLLIRPAGRHNRAGNGQTVARAGRSIATRRAGIKSKGRRRAGGAPHFCWSTSVPSRREILIRLRAKLLQLRRLARTWVRSGGDAQEVLQRAARIARCLRHRRFLSAEMELDAALARLRPGRRLHDVDQPAA